MDNMDSKFEPFVNALNKAYDENNVIMTNAPEEQAKIIARRIKILYDACIAEGFSEAQSFELASSIIMC